MNLGLGPHEGFGVDIIGGDEGVDMSHQLLAVVERGPRQGLGRQDREPDFDLIEPGRLGRSEVEMDVRVATPSAASRTIRARWRNRCSVFVERTKPSSSARSASVRMIGVASKLRFIATLNHDSRISDSGY
jgi:hypothetical protein